MTEYGFDAVIFDLDGVITKTALVHSAAWKKMFDGYLREREEKYGEPFKEFTHANDYLSYVDGKPRYKGVESFLQSRGINIPYGDPTDPPAKETICGLGNRKNEAFNEILEQEGVEVYDSTVALIKTLKSKGLKVGVASSSKNCLPVLEAARLAELFETRVDGVILSDLKLEGKPEPDIFTTACDNLGVTYDRAVVVEDAVSGVQAGAKGNFGLVLGLSRENNEQELKLNGADIVVTDIAEIGFAGIEAWFKSGLEEDKWSLNYFDYAPEKEQTREALCTVGNGYFGTRGAMEETEANEVNYPGAYIAGVYNRLESPVADRTAVNEDFVNCPNWLPVNFKIGTDDWFDINKAKWTGFHRKLDFRNGILSRRMVVTDQSGRQTLIESQRLASMANPHLAALKYSLTPLNYSAKITIRSGLDGDIINAGVERYRQLNSKHLEPVEQGAEGNTCYVVVKTNQSQINLAEAAKISVSLADDQINPQMKAATNPGSVYTEFNVDVPEENTLSVEKIAAIYTSKDKDVTGPLQSARNDLIATGDFDEVLRNSAQKWADLWQEIDVVIEGDRLAQKLLRLHLYHLMATTSPHHLNIDAGIPARGLHGEAYRGHIFWDELFILPLYNIHLKDAAKSVLLYRYRRLDQARKYAREHGYEGAMFPWQSGSDGREETQTLHLNPLSGEWGEDYSSLQRHVSLAIAYNIWQYYWATNDLAFLKNYGAEMFLEICRFWASKADFNDQTGRYEIKKVMGPDEFHEKYPAAKEGGLKDNTYTNLMVVWSFNRAFDILNLLDETSKQQVMSKINLTTSELNRWQDIGHKMNIVISKEGILAQYDGYFALKELDWDAYREKYGHIHRMDRILKAEGKSPDAYKVAKQADTLMTFYNLDPAEVRDILNDLGYALPAGYLRNNLEYYLQRTSHGSTLSRVVHAYLANLIDHHQLSWQLYMEALTSDYKDIQGGTTGEGIHTGVMAGTVILALTAYAGLDLKSDKVKITPNLPQQWRNVSFNFNFKEIAYAFEVTSQKVKVKVDKAVEVVIGEKEHRLKANEWIEIPL
jgi:beta-phosphoglucomutase family hydrolase